MVERCETCRWWNRDKPRDLLKEYADDPRPEVRGFFDAIRWLWEPEMFKQPPSGFALDFLHRPNPVLGVCRRMPKAIRTCEDEFCGEHQPKEQPSAT